MTHAAAIEFVEKLIRFEAESGQCAIDAENTGGAVVHANNHRSLNGILQLLRRAQAG